MGDDIHEKYFAKLYDEIEFYRERLKGDVIDTIYIGGGTPSFVNEKYIEGIFDRLTGYNISSNAEISIEMNPDSVTKDKLSVFRKFGINRISMGLQSTNDEILKRLGRVHDFDTAKKAIDLIKTSGIDNFNLDLMYNLPGQELSDVIKDIEFVASTGASHVSAYSLIIEEDTPFSKKYESGEFVFDEEKDSSFYDTVMKLLPEYGFERYEFSNFAKKGHECRHNLNCWDYQPYFGFGLNAHSFYDSKRFCNTSKMSDYLDCRDLDSIKEIYSEAVDKTDFIIIGFRKIEGIKLNDYKALFGSQMTDDYHSVIEDLCDKGLMEGYSKNGERMLRLTETGIKFSNQVLCEFV